MESSVVMVVGMMVILLSTLVKFHVRSTVMGSTVELRVTEQTKSCGFPITPCVAFGLKNMFGAGATYYNVKYVTSIIIL